MICGDLNGKEIHRRGDIHITDSLCSTVETNTTLQSNYTSVKFFLNKKAWSNLDPSVSCILSCCTIPFARFISAIGTLLLLTQAFYLESSWLEYVCLPSIPPFVLKDLSSSQQGLPWSTQSKVVHAHVCVLILDLTGKQKNSQLPWDSLIWKWEDWWRAHFWEQMWYKIMQIKAFLLSLEIKM